MKIAYLTIQSPAGLDQTLASFARELAAQGWRTAGLVQVNSRCAPDHPCDMDVQVLPQGPVFRISQALGPNARGCRLDASALETAVGEVGQRLTRDTDVLIVNKFGKHEADGRGFRDVIARAIELGIPVVAGVSALNLAAFQEFSGGLAEPVEPTMGALLDWLSPDSADRVA